MFTNLSIFFIKIIMSRVKISEDILKIKDLVGSPKKVRIRDIKEEILIQLKELNHRVEMIEKKLKEKESPITLRRRKQIIFLLKNNKLTASQVAQQLNLSRARANQYLKRMEEEGILQGEFRGKKKFYKVK